MTDFPGRRREIGHMMREYAAEAPATMAGFTQLHKAAMTDGELTVAVKELIALAIGITEGCEGCVAFHVHDALRAGATRGQVAEAIGVAVMMGGGPAAVHGAEAWDALEQFTASSVRNANGSTDV